MRGAALNKNKIYEQHITDGADRNAQKCVAPPYMDKRCCRNGDELRPERIKACFAGVSDSVNDKDADYCHGQH